ncbi:Pentatricopeptide repeat-containing protein [Spatholobus suberectus]|nr:Pentatricopeptide repeat-containing protein [Spatholobus suberectus]
MRLRSTKTNLKENMGKIDNDDADSGTRSRNQSGNNNMKKGLFQSEAVKGTRFDGKKHMNEITKATNSGSQLSCTFCMGKNGCRIVRSRTRIMNILIKSGKPQEAIVIFENMIEGGHQPSLAAYTTLLNALTTQKCFDTIHSSCLTS